MSLKKNGQENSESNINSKGDNIDLHAMQAVHAGHRGAHNDQAYLNAEVALFDKKRKRK